MELPNEDDQQLLDQLIEDEPTIITFRGRKRKLGWIRRGTIRKITHIMEQQGNDDKATCQAVAAVLLNGYWKIKFFWWLKWRLYYYIYQVGDDELKDILVEAKKKIPVRDYYLATIYLTAIKDTTMQMTKKEVAANFRQGQSTDKAGN
jgi:hypothetical protein